MTPTSAAKFASALLRNETLVYLTLRDEDLGEEGAIAFAKLIAASPTLRALSLNYCELGAEGCHLIVNAVEKNLLIEKLELKFNGMSRMDAQRLIDMERDYWWSLEIDDNLVRKSAGPSLPLLTQYRDNFKKNFRQYVQCV